MLDVLPEWAPTGGAVAMLGAVVWAIIRGALVPGRTHREIVAHRDAQIATLQSANDRLARQRDELLELAHLGVKVMEALPKAAEGAS